MSCVCVIACPAGLVHFEDAAGCNTHQLDGLRIVNRLTSLSAAELLVVRVQPCGAALRPVDISLEMLDLRCWILPREILVFIGTAGTDLVTTAPVGAFTKP
mgnify:CR=1 FL=1